MKLKFLRAEEIHNAKATVHSTGRLGFSTDANEFLSLAEGKSIQFAQNEEDETDDNLYAVIHDGIQEGAFRVAKAGKYFSVNTKNLLDTLHIDYKKTKIIFDLIKIEYEGQEIIKMKKRELRKKNMPT